MMFVVYRVFHRRRKMTIIMLIPPLLYFIEHVRYLYSGGIDYEYNMMINVAFGKNHISFIIIS